MPTASKPIPVHFETLGCRLNQIESESAAKAFFDAGFTPSMQSESAADDSLVDAGTNNDVPLCVVNTCTVTGKAEQKARRIIRVLLKKFPQAAILVTGCYAQLDAESLAAMDKRVVILAGLQKDLLADIPANLRTFLECGNTADRVISGETIAEFLSACIARKRNAADAALRFPFKLSTDTFFAHSRASLKIQDGCDNACSYCRIRLARGKSVSLDAESVLDRVKTLEAQGYGEVTLTGVNLSQYAATGADGEPVNISRLIALILQHTARINVRISSLHPQTIDDEFCAVIRDSRVRAHFHLSVQSGSDRVLAAMNRPYTATTVASAVEKLRAAKSNGASGTSAGAPFIACDVIAGFPGETDADFAATLNLCESCNFSWIHAFPFSPRPGTPAFTLPNRISPQIAKTRVGVLGELAARQKNAYIVSWQGKETTAIIEHTHVLADSHPPVRTLVRGVTANFLHVEIALPAEIAASSKLDSRADYPVKILHPLETHCLNDCEAAAELL